MLECRAGGPDPIAENVNTLVTWLHYRRGEASARARAHATKTRSRKRARTAGAGTREPGGA